MTASQNSSSFIRLWFASFIAQFGYLIFSMLTVAGVAALAGVGADGLGQGLLTFGILMVVGLFLLLPLSFFTIPLMLKPLARGVADRKVSFGSAFIANLAASLLVLLTMGFMLLIPGGQLFVVLLSLIFASAICAAIILGLGGLSDVAKDSYNKAEKLVSSAR